MVPRGQKESNTQDLTRPVPSPQTLVGPIFSFLPPNGVLYLGPKASVPVWADPAGPVAHWASGSPAAPSSNLSTANQSHEYHRKGARGSSGPQQPHAWSFLGQPGLRRMAEPPLTSEVAPCGWSVIAGAGKLLHGPVLQATWCLPQQPGLVSWHQGHCILCKRVSVAGPIKLYYKNRQRAESGQDGRPKFAGSQIKWSPYLTLSSDRGREVFSSLARIPRPQKPGLWKNTCFPYIPPW